MPTLQFASVQRDNMKDWLRYLQNPKVNMKRVARYEDELIAALYKSVNVPQEFHDAIKVLMRVFPYFAFRLNHAEKWSHLLMEALLPAQDLRDPEMETQLFRWFGETYLKKGKLKGAKVQFETALDHANNGRRNDMILAAYIGLLKLQWFDIKNPIILNTVQEILQIASKVEDKALRAEFHNTLAHVYLRIGETSIALGHAQMNYVYRYAANDPIELSAAAMTMAIVYRNIALYHETPVGLVHANYFLDQAWSNMSNTEYTWRYPLLAYEAGILSMQQGNFVKAEDWLKHALATAIKMNTPQHIVIAHHALGLTETHLGKWDESHENLLTALKMWQEMDNQYEVANLLQGLGYLEYRAFHPEKALGYLNDAMKLCLELQDVTQRDRLKGLIQQTIDQVSSDSTSARS